MPAQIYSTPDSHKHTICIVHGKKKWCFRDSGGNRIGWYEKRLDFFGEMTGRRGTWSERAKTFRRRLDEETPVSVQRDDKIELAVFFSLTACYI